MSLFWAARHDGFEMEECCNNQGGPGECGVFSADGRNSTLVGPMVRDHVPRERDGCGGIRPRHAKCPGQVRPMSDLSMPMLRWTAGRGRPWLLCLVALLAAGWSSGCVPAESEASSPASAEARLSRRPLRIGKLIKKRQIAPVFRVAHTSRLTRPERDEEEQPDRVVEALNIPQEATAVDLGVGVGYFTWRLAKKVGPQGRVIAVDIQQGMLDLLAENLRQRGITNVDSVLASPDGPGLPREQVDLVLLVDVYHELAEPEKTMEHVRQSLKQNGRVVIIEYRKEDSSIPIDPLHKMTVKEVRAEVEPVGYKLIEVLDFLPTQHILIFQDARPRGS